MGSECSGEGRERDWAAAEEEKGPTTVQLQHAASLMDPSPHHIALEVEAGSIFDLESQRKFQNCFDSPMENCIENFFETVLLDESPLK